ncbi:cytochrome c oxidase assembly protein subunit 15 [Tistlia consotensis]|uniref:Heme A synthase n=1 Tax=Tistlia consotensis USBA 355 TaxID=560819 RepID=A0A1Y6BFD1_9PROT|nr:COX15/CtaA family protein [Tistlia consotensis]SMF07117.1 cytochrome c oxidase assembly protein subunit 15 [Tistlia consotensis USBA 355]SNR36082.1 cytochrome c oxidase assembly protein subunit 15 [Tistlia consotensis]
MSAVTLSRSARTSRAAPRAVAAWLLICCAMIFAMAVIGAITRLTESGLSIMEWDPITGAIPPLSHAEWERLFGLYQETGEYRSLPGGMTLGGFQQIFWWEWIHRLWGRTIGLVYLLPFLWFLWRRKVPAGFAAPLWIGFGLGALQGFMGWFMVESGFSARTDVSQYRLVMHLGLALLIYSYLLWIALSLLRGVTPPAPRAPRRSLPIFLALLVLTLAAGGFVAGTDAGLTYNTFPLMDGRLVPSGYAALSPWWLNWFETIAAVQFDHRLLATLTLLGALALAWRSWARAGGTPLARGLALVAAAALLQYCLGVATLLAAVPVPLGALHQAGAILLLTATVDALHRRFARPRASAGTAPGMAGVAR